jgi:hypothetical protein
MNISLLRRARRSLSPGIARLESLPLLSTVPLPVHGPELNHHRSGIHQAPVVVPVQAGDHGKSERDVS